MSRAVPRGGEQEQPWSWVSQTPALPASEACSLHQLPCAFGVISNAQQMSLQLPAVIWMRQLQRHLHLTGR